MSVITGVSSSSCRCMIFNFTSLITSYTSCTSNSTIYPWSCIIIPTSTIIYTS
jgi:hypothetical protein